MGGDTCGPGTSLAGNVCVVAPADATGSDEMTTEEGPAQVLPDGPVPDTAQVDATASLDGGPDTGTGALDAQSPEATGADATGVIDADASDVAPFDSPNDSVGADVADATDAADASDAAPAERYVFGPPPACPGDGGVPPATFVPLEGGLREILIDPCNAHVYVTNQSANRVEDYSVAAAALEAPIAVGSSPHGFDITPDGQRLYVANSGGANVSVVDLGTRQELRKISFTSNFAGDTPLSLAIAANGTAFFSTTFGGSGFGGRMMSFDLATEAVTQRTDFYIRGTTTEATILKASADRSVIGIVAGDISSAPVFSYRSATDTFSPEDDLNGFIERVTVSADGSLLLVDGSQVLDPTPNLLGTIQGATTAYAAFGPSAAVAYRASTSGIDVLDTAHFLTQSTISVTADTIQGAGSYGPSAAGNLAVSSDGKWIALITDHGLAIVDVP